MDLGISERVATLIKAVRDMVENDIAPLDAEYHALVGTHPTGDRFKHTDRQLGDTLAHQESLQNKCLQITMDSHVHHQDKEVNV